MSRFTLRLFFWLALAVGVVWLWERYLRQLNPFATEAKTTQTTVLQEMVAMGKVELVKFSFKDVVEHELVRPLLPNSKVLLIAYGEAVGCIDLAKVKPEDIVSQNDSLLITLPSAEICFSKIDHSKSKVYNTDFAIFQEGQLVEEAYRQAEVQLAKSAQEMNILPQTQTNAEKMLKPLFEKISNKKVRFIYKLL
jgi:hypothetical protein